MMRQRRQGFSLLEIIAAITLTAVIAVASMSFLNRAGTDATSRACQSHRVTLQNDVELYLNETGQSPSRNLSQLATPDYAGDTPFVCPTTGRSFELVNGQVVCAEHP